MIELVWNIKNPNLNRLVKLFQFVKHSVRSFHRLTESVDWSKMTFPNTSLVYPAVKFAYLKGLAQAKIIKKSVILFRVLNMTI